MQYREINSLDSIMDGALNERFNVELSKVWDNIFDMRTNPKATRTITMEIKIKPNKTRSAAEMMADVKVKLAAPEALIAPVHMNIRDDGSVRVVEMSDQVVGQIDMDGNTNVPRMVEFRKPESAIELERSENHG